MRNKIVRFTILNQPYSLLLLLGCIALAVGLRVWGLNFGLPYVYHPDEVVAINGAQHMIKTGDWNPHFFHWPSLIFYLNAVLYELHFLIGKLLGLFQSTGDIPAPVMLGMAVGYMPMPSIWLLSRVLTMSLGVGAVILAFLNGRTLMGKTAIGLLAAFLVAISPTNVANSRFVTPDTFATFFLMLAFYGTIHVFQTGQTRYYVLNGIAIGLAVSSKYNAALVAIPFLLAHFHFHGLKGIKDPRLYGTGILSIAAFFATTPYAILDWPTFWEALQFDAAHYSTGHAGMEGNTLSWYLSYLWRVEGLVFILAVLEIGRGIYGRSRKTILLALFPVIYFAFISSMVVRNDRTLLPAIPFFILLVANLLVAVYDWLRQKPLSWRRYGTAALIMVTAVTIIIPLNTTIKTGRRITAVDSRETARVWIAENLPPGAKITFESYAPYIDPGQFTVQYINDMKVNPLEVYKADGTDYLVFSAGSYRRFFNDPERYANEIAIYEQLWSQLESVKIFNDGDFEIRIYAIPK
ncbi:MAG: glycosyltransferase family 39 protein [Ardenticatenaceae bacterium]|nr:glycosyltransferase family 39 protein [Ardenticatenaceae bacterium]MCB9444784.1 glycosyltransferase family 39 protein [Ardenticatenaceae bacterium]